ncbi:ATP-dependent DNA helicase RecQ [Waterburya agarophytonicola K14]|uniref:ATP-dependent DNA helicase RecQ n=1 Tax=Waterburya agarophytonicola KI4 TaxID=2874699 RepID=A0A964BN97_9CYAN|nr:RecQ family ATP-dependent DNA helicase [Waterburya agarophytonicola]MCC0175463.1 ATP-dependent DNA helicase RecQ [Waterburya agarophytonicola KI4]
MDIAWHEVREKFKTIWGYQDFKSPQGEIIRTLLDGKDALVVLPTGGGKSICFQLPALVQTGLTIVVSPLVALMENQVSQLKQLGLSGALLHGELSKRDRQYTLQAILRQRLSLLYLSPETLLSVPLWEIISQPQIKITGIILDEVHCLTQWGNTFRPGYRRLGAVRRSLLKHKPGGTKIAIAAFTATADPQTQTEIIQVLELKQPEIFLVSPYRPNLNLKIKTVWTPRGRKEAALKFIRANKNSSGLVYVRSRRDSQVLAQWFRSLNYSVAAYHAGLVSSQRRKIEQEWISGKIQFAICTSAFGMGIDKGNVRFIIHYHPPELIAEYIQEVGRAGRDSKPAHTLTLISEPTGWFDPEDKQRSQFFKRQLEEQYRAAQRLIKELPNRGDIATIKQQFPQGEITLAILHSLGLLSWQDPFHYRKHSARLTSHDLFNSQKYYQKQMQQYLKTKQCRWKFLLQAFGFEEKREFKCGNCDRCLGNNILEA